MNEFHYTEMWMADNLERKNNATTGQLFDANRLI